MRARVPVAVTLLILAAAIGVGWKNHQRLIQTRAKYERLSNQASERGISLDSSSRARVTKLQREDPETKAKLASEKFISFGRALEALETQRGPADVEFQKLSIEFLASMASLDVSQFKRMLSEVADTNEMSDDTRGRLIGGGLRKLAHADPRTALTILTELSDLINSPGLVENLVSEALFSWAKDDPGAALAWLRINAAQYPDLVTGGAKSSLIVGVSIQDPKLAFHLIEEIEVANRVQTIRRIASAASSAEARSATVAALREHLATLPDPEIRKETAALAYAEKVFSKDPDTAILWATSVPATEDRDRTLKRLHDEWPKNDPEGAAAFAQEHGFMITP